MTNELIYSFSTSLIIRGMQIKTTMRYHYIVIRMAIIKKRKKERKKKLKQKTSIVKNADKLELVCIFGENAK